jgi:hypothetical protein
LAAEQSTMLRPRPLMAAILKLRRQWEQLSDIAYSPKVEDELAKVYRYAWEALEDIFNYERAIERGMLN